jgi:hypothetical protein
VIHGGNQRRYSIALSADSTGDVAASIPREHTVLGSMRIANFEVLAEQLSR